MKARSPFGKRFRYRRRIWYRWIAYWEKCFGYKHQFLLDPSIQVHEGKRYIEISLRQGSESILIGESRYPSFYWR